MSLLYEQVKARTGQVFRFFNNYKFPASLGVIAFLSFKNFEMNKQYRVTSVEKSLIATNLDEKMKEVQTMSVNLLNYQAKLKQKEKLLRDFAKKNEEIQIEMAKVAASKGDPKAREAQMKIIKERETQLKALEKEMKAKDDEMEQLSKNMQQLFAENDKLRKENIQLKTEQMANSDAKIAELTQQIGQQQQEMTTLTQKIVKYEARVRVYEVRLLTYSNGNFDSKKEKKLETSYKSGKIKQARVFVKLDRKLNDGEILEVEISNVGFKMSHPVSKKNYNPYDELYVDFQIPKNSLKTGELYAKIVRNGEVIGYDKVTLIEGV